MPVPADVWQLQLPKLFMVTQHVNVLQSNPFRLDVSLALQTPKLIGRTPGTMTNVTHSVCEPFM